MNSIKIVIVIALITIELFGCLFLFKRIQSFPQLTALIIAITLGVIVILIGKLSVITDEDYFITYTKAVMFFVSPILSLLGVRQLFSINRYLGIFGAALLTSIVYLLYLAVASCCTFNH
jgi:hypothetical protein